MGRQLLYSAALFSHTKAISYKGNIKEMQKQLYYIHIYEGAYVVPNMWYRTCIFSGTGGTGYTHVYLFVVSLKTQLKSRKLLNRLLILLRFNRQLAAVGGSCADRGGPPFVHTYIHE